MIYLSDVLEDWPNVTQHKGEWVPARPIPGPFISRVRDAWGVLTGRSDAFVWPEDELEVHPLSTETKT